MHYLSPSRFFNFCVYCFMLGVLSLRLDTCFALRCWRDWDLELTRPPHKHNVFSHFSVKFSMSGVRRASRAGEGGQALTRQLIRYSNLTLHALRPRIPMSFAPRLSIIIILYYCVCVTSVSESADWLNKAKGAVPWTQYRRFLVIAP